MPESGFNGGASLYIWVCAPLTKLHPVRFILVIDHSIVFMVVLHLVLLLLYFGNHYWLLECFIILATVQTCQCSKITVYRDQWVYWKKKVGKNPFTTHFLDFYVGHQPFFFPLICHITANASLELQSIHPLSYRNKLNMSKAYSRSWKWKHRDWTCL